MDLLRSAYSNSSDEEPEPAPAPSFHPPPPKRPKPERHMTSISDRNCCPWQISIEKEASPPGSGLTTHYGP
ncbi:hypothetical protein NL676_027282 [Syzygium grande]|nr:hypothetical protein NL676_027282 [Syzygium grande]